jgi:hypothetical protein
MPSAASEGKVYPHNPKRSSEDAVGESTPLVLKPVDEALLVAKKL